MNTPALRFRLETESSHTEAQVHGEWEERRLDKAFRFDVATNTLSRAQLAENGTVRNIHYGDVLIKFGSVLDIESQTVPFVADDLFRCNTKNRLMDGDVVMADTAEDEAVGKVTEILGATLLPTVSGLHTIVLRPLEKFGKGFLGYCLNAPAYHDNLASIMQGVKVLSINKGALSETRFSAPSLPEQQKIGVFFRTLDALIAEREEAIGKTEAIKKSMLQKMFPQGDATVPEVRFGGFEGEWRIFHFDQVFQHVSSKGYQIQADEYLDIGEYPVVDQGQMPVVGYSNNSSKVCRAKANPVIVFGDHTRIVKYVDFDFVVGADGTQLLRAMGHDLSFLTAVVRGLPLPNMGYSRHFKLLQESTFLLPSLPEQQKIGAFFRSLDALIAGRREEVEKLKQMKKALLERMFV